MMKRTALAKILVVTLAVVAITATGCRSKRPDKNITPIPGTGAFSVNVGEGNPALANDNTGGELDSGNPAGNYDNPPSVIPIGENTLNPDTSFQNPATTGPSEVSNFGMDPNAPVTENATIWAQNTIRFSFDSSVVGSSEIFKLTEIANQLTQQRHLGVKVEGHCDERGTEEYNRALGERRANSVRDHLIEAGVNPNQIRTLSYGEDMPEDPGHDEAAWAANRRAVFILLTPR